VEGADFVGADVTCAAVVVTVLVVAWAAEATVPGRPSACATSAKTPKLRATTAPAAARMTARRMRANRTGGACAAETTAIWLPGSAPTKQKPESCRRKMRQSHRAELATLELRLALLDERRETFFRIGGCEQLTERVGLGLEVRGVVAAERLVRKLLHGRERSRALRGEQLRSLARLVEHGIMNRTDEPDAQ